MARRLGAVGSRSLLCVCFVLLFSSSSPKHLCAIHARFSPPHPIHYELSDPAKVDGRAVRRSLNKTGRYVRKPNKDPKSNELMEQHGVGYSSTGLVAQMREQDNLWTQGEVTVKLAKAYGYCWGVERAVRMAYEARNAFPDRRVHITNEIIHNPEVNQVRVLAWIECSSRGKGWGLLWPCRSSSSSMFVPRSPADNKSSLCGSHRRSQHPLISQHPKITTAHHHSGCASWTSTSLRTTPRARTMAPSRRATW